MDAQLETEKLRRQVSTLAAFGGQALRAQDVGELLQEATRLVSEAIEVDLVKVLEPIANGQELLVRAGVNWNPGVVGQATIPADGGSAAGHALRTNAPVISDVATERRFSTPRLLIEHGVQSTVNVVIRGEKGPFGVLEVDSRQRRSFGQDDIDFLQNYANLLASAVDRLDRQQELEEGMKRQQLLFNELQHRVNNMLTTIRAVARRTRAHSANLDQFAKALDDRLSALARIHNLFSQPGKMAATMREILTQELSAQGAVEGNNFVQHGPDIALPTREAELLSMAFHELATNAVKHGALSAKDGRICITWVINRAENGEHVLVRWRESGVSIEQPPTRRGFGSELLEKSILDLPAGRFDRTFHPDGIEGALQFRVEINVPAAGQRYATAMPELALKQQ